MSAIPLEFVTVDGEQAGDHYILLASSLGDNLWNERGISTRDCLEFLLGLYAKRRLISLFGMNYDVNMMLRDVPLRALRRLWATGVCVVDRYRIEWIPGKWFAVRHEDGRHVKVCESFGFFQCSFVVACKTWGIELPPSISEMKAKRGSFTADDRLAITRYCVSECEALSDLMRRLATTCQLAGVVPKVWIGAGSIAAELLRTNGVEAHLVHDADLSDDPAHSEMIMRACFGARFEIVRQGQMGTVQTADIRSAYPSAMTTLPSLAGATLTEECPSGWWEEEFGMAEIEFTGNWELGPFPVRNSRAIYFPLWGIGVYHLHEIRAAVSAGLVEDLKVRRLLALRPASAERPMAWVPDVFELRKAYKAANDPREKVLKLALNSCYGKLAQGVGWRGSTPRWQSYLWAGMVTAHTRAQILRALPKMRRVAMIACDGIMAQDVGNLKSSAELGGWDIGEYQNFCGVQSGIYVAERDGEEIVRTRGIYAREIDGDALRAAWDEGPDSHYQYQSTRFHGLGYSLRTGMTTWRQWVTASRTVTFELSRKTRAYVRDGEGWYDTRPAGGEQLGPSEPYVPRAGPDETAADDDNAMGFDDPLHDG